MNDRQKMQKFLNDRKAVITGAASGIGLAVANSLADAGAKVCLVDIQADLLEKETLSINKKGHFAISVTADLRSEDDILKLRKITEEEFGSVDILINNAGLQYVSAIDDLPVEQWDKLLDIMLRGAFLCTQQFLPPMAANGWGRIVNVASIHSIVASKFKSAYISAKHGLIGLTKTAALESAESGVTVNAVSPAYVRTPLVEDQIESQAKLHGLSKDDVMRTVMLAPMPQKELIEPSEIGEIVAFLCSGSARHINGHNLVIDGGWTIT
jgi:3-hydroxybutyrate dehydrogenase